MDMSMWYSSPITNVNPVGKTWNNSGSTGNYSFNNNYSGNNNSTIASSITDRLNASKKAKKNAINEQTRSLMRNLNNAKKEEAVPYGEVLKNKTFTGTVQNKKNGFFDLKSTYENMQKSLPTKKYHYNYKEVSNRIRTAKTSVGAGQAVIAAKRKVIEIKRKLSVKSDDADELRLALIHAERMEAIARKKKHNLEQEELISNTAKRDEAFKKQEEAGKSSDTYNITQAIEEEITTKEEEIFDERYKMAEEMVSQLQEGGLDDITEEMMQEMNDLIASFGEDELRELEDAMQLMESMEIIDPHMSEEDLAKLKSKHRNDEYKALMKADMDYLKAVLKLNAESMSKSSDTSASSSVGFGAPIAAVVSEAPEAAPVEATPTFDIAL